MNVLRYKSYSLLNELRKEFSTINEGIKFSCEHSKDTEEVIVDYDIEKRPINKSTYDYEIDYDNDTPEDVVKLANPSPIRSSKMENITAWAGYNLEDPRVDGHRLKNCFSEWSKKWDSFSDSELTELIDYSFPQELKSKNVRILFSMGSSSPLSSRIADILKSLYYPNAKIIDIMKAYYGVDKRNIINWDEYEKVGPVQRNQIDTFLNGITDFDGYIKKGGRIQTGQTRDRVLKDGHYTDSYIIKSIIGEMLAWKESTKHENNWRIAVSNIPYFLTVDDIIVQGSTIKRALMNIKKEISGNTIGLNSELKRLALSNLGIYAMFSYGSRFRPKE